MNRLLAPLTLLTCLLQDLSIAQQERRPVDVVRLAATATGNAIKSADLKGTYESLDVDGTAKVTADVRIRFSRDKFLVELDQAKGFRYGRIVAVADESGVCEATFSPRINPTGCHGDLYQRLSLVEKSPVGDGPFWYYEGRTPIWLQGRLLVYHILNSVPFDGEHTKVERMKDGRFVGTFIPKFDESFITGEFGTRPEFGDNLSEFGITDKRGGRTSTSVRWKKTDGCWFLEEFEEKMWYQDEFKRHTRIRFSDIKINKDLPPDLFSVKSLGLVPGTRILDRHPKQGTVAYNYVPREPQEGDTIRREVMRREVRWVK